MIYKLSPTINPFVITKLFDFTLVQKQHKHFDE